MIRKALDLEPGSFESQMMLGSVLARSGRYGEASMLANRLERSARSQDEKNRVRSFAESLGRIQGRTDAGLEPERTGDPGAMESEKSRPFESDRDQFLVPGRSSTGRPWFRHPPRGRKRKRPLPVLHL